MDALPRATASHRGAPGDSLDIHILRPTRQRALGAVVVGRGLLTSPQVALMFRDACKPALQDQHPFHRPSVPFTGPLTCFTTTSMNSLYWGVKGFLTNQMKTDRGREEGRETGERK